MNIAEDRNVSLYIDALLWAIEVINFLDSTVDLIASKKQ